MSESWTLHSERQTSKSKLQMPNTNIQTLNDEVQGPNVEGQTSRDEHQGMNTEGWKLRAKCWGPNAEGWMSRSKFQGLNAKGQMQSQQSMTNTGLEVVHPTQNHTQLCIMLLGDICPCRICLQDSSLELTNMLLASPLHLPTIWFVKSLDQCLALGKPQFDYFFTLRILLTNSFGV